MQLFLPATPIFHALRFGQIRRGALCATLAALCCLASTPPAQAAPAKDGDALILQMRDAYPRRDTKLLSATLPQVKGHILEPWAAYWELRARLQFAGDQEVSAFLKRWQGTYQEDRMRNDWLLELGDRGDWPTFLKHLPHFRMRDDRQVTCYEAAARFLTTGQPLDGEMVETVRSNWYAQRKEETPCTSTMSTLFQTRQVSAEDVWKKARKAANAGLLRMAGDAVRIIAPGASESFVALWRNPRTWLKKMPVPQSDMDKQLTVIALLRVASDSVSEARALMHEKRLAALPADARNWLWGLLGKTSALRLEDDAMDYFEHIKGKDVRLSDDIWAWKARAALRAGNWEAVHEAIANMDIAAQKENIWVYWNVRSMKALNPHSNTLQGLAQEILQEIAGIQDFYSLLALNDLGLPVVFPPAPSPLTPAEIKAAHHNEGLQRALYAIRIGMRSEGVREWNYTTNLHTPGGMDERALYAAAALACEAEVWDRCINTSARTKSFANMQQRFPTPFYKDMRARNEAIGLSTAYVYGLIRQESRFIMDACSSAGARGLMQIMPATARWTAKKIGLANFKSTDITDPQTNITIGTAYLKLALDDMEGSMPMAAAAYNAGPNRPRRWREGPVLEAPIWIENIPFGETREYVKNVLANTTIYDALMNEKPDPIGAHLLPVGPRVEPESMPDLP